MPLHLSTGATVSAAYTGAGAVVDHAYDRLGRSVYSRTALPQISSFRSNPSNLLASVQNVAEIDLSWTVTGATNIVIKDASGATIHTSTADIGMYRVATPAADTHWTLEATNAGGMSTSQWMFYRTIPASVSLLTSRITQAIPGGIPTILVDLSCRIEAHPWHAVTVSVSPELYGARAHSANRFFQNRTGDPRREGIVAQLRRTVSPSITGTSTTYRVQAINSLAPPASSATTQINW